MKKVIVTILAAIGIGSGGLYLGGGFSFEDKFYLVGGSGVNKTVGLQSATTTVLHLITGDTATSSITGFASQGQNINLELQFNASTTASNLQWFVYQSHDRIDWFAEDCLANSTTTVTTTLFHTPTSCVHNWTPGVTGISRKIVDVGPVQAKYFKIDFGVTGANGSLWAVAIPKNEDPK